MYFDFHFNYKFNLKFWEIQCDTLTFEKTYVHIFSPLENSKIPLMNLGKITPMCPDFYFNCKFDISILGNTMRYLKFEKTYIQIPSSIKMDKNIKGILLNILKNEYLLKNPKFNHFFKELYFHRQ